MYLHQNGQSEDHVHIREHSRDGPLPTDSFPFRQMVHLQDDIRPFGNVFVVDGLVYPTLQQSYT